MRSPIEVAADLVHHRGEVPPREIPAERERVSPGNVARIDQVQPGDHLSHRTPVDDAVLDDRGDREHRVTVGGERLVVQVDGDS